MNVEKIIETVKIVTEAATPILKTILDVNDKLKKL